MGLVLFLSGFILGIMCGLFIASWTVKDNAREHDGS